MEERPPQAPTEGSRVVINVSGEMFETYNSTLQQYPTTLLGDERKREVFYCAMRKQYFFDRNRLAFSAILFFYQSKGRLLKPPDLALQPFEEECLFFGIPETSINQMKVTEGSILKKRKKETGTNGAKLLTTRLTTRHVWNFLENPETSMAAQAFAICSLLVIATSVVMDCLETVPSVRRATVATSRFQDSWSLVELALNAWFLLEFLLRFIFAPKKVKFVRSTMNFMDLLSVGPFFIVLTAGSSVSSLSFLRILRLIRVIRLFRLSKHSKRLVVVGHILKHSASDFQQLLLCLFLLVVFGGSVLYFAEGYVEDTQFTSIPESLWWAIQTVMVLGYGDIVPVSVLGKLLATGLMVFGALTISLPVLSIVMRFTQMYKQNTEAF